MQKTILVEAICNLSELDWRYAIYAKDNQPPFPKYLEVVVANPDEDENRLAAIDHNGEGYLYLISVQSLQDVVKNARQQRPGASEEDLLDALNYYYIHDAFVVFTKKTPLNNVILDKIKLAVRDVEKALAEKDYQRISSPKRNSRLSEAEIATAIKEYPGGKQLTLSPKSAYDNLRVIEVKNSIPRQWHIDFDLWFDQKPSDLTLQLTIVREDEDFLCLIDDIHVL